jgi:hypothetical protein
MENFFGHLKEEAFQFFPSGGLADMVIVMPFILRFSFSETA